MKLYDQNGPAKPQMPDRKILLLRARLIFEEAMEFVEAAGCTVIIDDSKSGTIFDRVIVINNETEPSLKCMVDSIGDILVVTYGTANALGIKVEPVWNEIQRSNLAKVWPDGTIHKREDGKVIKPTSWNPPDIERILEEQCNQDDSSPSKE